MYKDFNLPHYNSEKTQDTNSSSLFFFSHVLMKQRKEDKRNLFLGYEFCLEGGKSEYYIGQQ